MARFDFRTIRRELQQKHRRRDSASVCDRPSHSRISSYQFQDDATWLLQRWLSSCVSASTVRPLCACNVIVVNWVTVVPFSLSLLPPSLLRLYHNTPTCNMMSACQMVRRIFAWRLKCHLVMSIVYIRYLTAFRLMPPIQFRLRRCRFVGLAAPFNSHHHHHHHHP